MPPTERLEDYLELVAALEATAEEGGVNVEARDDIAGRRDQRVRESLAGLRVLLITTHRPGYAVKWSDKTEPEHDVTLPFTRMFLGPMDYTPVTFSASRRQTSAAHELALSVVFASGLQHFADSPEACRRSA